MPRLFSLAKIPLFLDTYKPAVEKRRGDEVSVLVLTLRVQPFNAQLAVSIDDGIGLSSKIHSTVFMRTEPKPQFTRHNLKLELGRQLLTIFASPDTKESTFAIDQAKISGAYVRTSAKDTSTLALIFKASFGPVSREELEYVHAWTRTQRSVTFTESEVPLNFHEADDDEPPQPGPRTPMFETDANGHPL